MPICTTGGGLGWGVAANQAATLLPIGPCSPGVFAARSPVTETSFVPPWTPIQLSGLLGWWYVATTQCFSDEAGTVACGNGDGIRVWNNAQGGTDISQATSTARATYSTTGPAATFDAGDSYGLFSTGSPAGLFSFHRVKTSTLGFHNIYDNIVGGNFVMLWVDSDGRFEPDAQGVGCWGAGPVITDGAWHTVFLFRSATVATRMWVDGAEITPGVGEDVRTIPATIDLFSRAGLSGFNGSATEFGFATALPSASQLTALQAYLVR